MFSRVIMYIIAVALGLGFALYLSAGVGWTFVYVLVCAPVFSFLMTFFLYKRKSTSLRAEVSSTMLYKQETVTLKIIAENRSIFPVPAIKLKLAAPAGFEAAEDCEGFLISIPPRSETAVEITYKAKVWGTGYIGAESVLFYDFIGFFSFKMPCAELLCGVKVFPDIPEMAGDAPLLKATSESAKYSDDSEETKESENFNNFSGVPGYTHREYTEGDPVRRINWKLSSKRDKYMVRLDDEIETVRQKIILDCVGSRDPYENERAVEGILAAALGLLKCGFESTVYCRFGGVYEAFEMTEPADVSALQTRFAEYDFADGGFKGKRIPDLSGEGSSGLLFFTPFFDKKLAGEIAAAEDRGVLTAVINAGALAEGSAYQVWRLNEDYSADLET